MYNWKIGKLHGDNGWLLNYSTRTRSRMREVQFSLESSCMFTHLLISCQLKSNSNLWIISGLVVLLIQHRCLCLALEFDILIKIFFWIFHAYTVRKSCVLERTFNRFLIWLSRTHWDHGMTQPFMALNLHSDWNLNERKLNGVLFKFLCTHKQAHTNFRVRERRNCVCVCVAGSFFFLFSMVMCYSLTPQ